MRITSVNNEMQNLNGGNFKKSFKVGDIVKGRVIDLSESRIMLKTSAEQFINAVIWGDKTIKKDSLIEIIITKISDNKVYAQFLEANSREEASKNEVLNILNKLGVDSTEFNIDIFKTLVKHRQPINNDIFDYINYLTKAAEHFKNNDIREVLSLVFSEKDILNIPLHELSGLTLSADLDNILNIENLQTGIINEKINKEKIDDIGKVIFQSNDLDKMNLIKLKQLFSGAVKAVNSLKKADIKSLVFMMSKNIEVTAENLYIYNEINNKVEVISGYMDKMLKNLADVKEPEIQSIIVGLNEIFLKAEEVNIDNVNTKLKKFINLLAQLESSLEAKGKNNYEIRETLMDLRNTLNLMKSINDNMNYVQIPIIINNKQTDAKIFVYEKGKKNKNIDPANANVLICLNTRNLGYIESYIEMRNKNVNITFKSEDKAEADTIDYYKGMLKEVLKLKGYNVNIHAIERKGDNVDLASIEEIFSSKEIAGYSIDVRI